MFFFFQRFFHESVEQNDHVMVRINTPYQQQPPQLFLKNASISSIADLPFDNNTVLSNSGVSNKPIKDKSHNYTTNRLVRFLLKNGFGFVYYSNIWNKVTKIVLYTLIGITYQKALRTRSHPIHRLTASVNLHVRQIVNID